MKKLNLIAQMIEQSKSKQLSSIADGKKPNKNILLVNGIGTNVYTQAWSQFNNNEKMPLILPLLPLPFELWKK